MFSSNLGSFGPITSERAAPTTSGFGIVGVAEGMVHCEDQTAAKTGHSIVEIHRYQASFALTHRNEQWVIILGMICNQQEEPIN